MEPGGSLPSSQEPPTGPHPEPDQSNPYHTIPSYLCKIHFNIVDPPTSWSSQWLGGSFVTTEWRVLKLRMEETPSRYGG
jgi:hypothetical protein